MTLPDFLLSSAALSSLSSAPLPADRGLGAQPSRSGRGLRVISPTTASSGGKSS
jgi:hypothetical protein